MSKKFILTGDWEFDYNPHPYRISWSTHDDRDYIKYFSTEDELKEFLKTLDVEKIFSIKISRTEHACIAIKED